MTDHSDISSYRKAEPIRYVCKKCGTETSFTPNHYRQDRTKGSGIQGMIYSHKREAFGRKICSECLNRKRQQLQQIMLLIEQYAS